MITELHIKNFKSVADLAIKLGRVTVLIGENGGGKSNILEALALASAAASNKLDNEFLVSRGIRVAEPKFMRSAFGKESQQSDIEVEVVGSDDRFWAQMSAESEPPYTSWRNVYGHDSPYTVGENSANDSIMEDLLRKAAERSSERKGDEISEESARRFIKELLRQFETQGRMPDAASKENSMELADSAKTSPESWRKPRPEHKELASFLIYSPENTALRTFEREGQILPLGIRGEGLFKLLTVLSGVQHRERLRDIKENLALIDWYGDFRVPPGTMSAEQALEIGDRYLDPDLAYFDQRSANEGFLFLLFYFALFVSSDTPAFFAIDNVDASLNPKLCTELVKRLVILSQKYNKQVVLTTHNPAVLDGLNLHDAQQRLLVVYRNSKGVTRARRISAPKPIAGEPPVKLSEAFLRGILGGLPQNF